MTGWQITELAVSLWLGSNAALVVAMCVLKPRKEVTLASLVRPIVPADLNTDDV